MFQEGNSVEQTTSNAPMITQDFYSSVMASDLEVQRIVDTKCNGLDILPRGPLGAIALHIYKNHHSELPIEYLVPAVYGLAAGICGLKYQSPTHEGLNLSMIVMGVSSTGKSVLRTGLVKVLNELMEHETLKYTKAKRLVDTDEVSHGNAFFPKFKEMPSFCWVNSEFGNDFAEMKASHTSPKRTVYNKILKLWDNSNTASGGFSISYTKKDDCIDIPCGVGLTLIGESVKESVLSNLSVDDLDNGTLSRFMLVEYKGGIPPAKEDSYRLSPRIAEYIVKLVGGCVTEYSQLDVRKVYAFYPREKVLALREKYRLIANHALSTNDKVGFICNNRKASKVFKIASLEAVFTNFASPVVTDEMIARAERVVSWFDATVIENVASGDLDDSNGVVSLISKAAEDFIKSGPKTYLKGSVTLTPEIVSKMREDGMIPEVYFKQRYKQNARMKDLGRGDATAGIEKAISAAARAGVLLKTAPMDNTGLHKYGFTGVIWGITDIQK